MIIIGSWTVFFYRHHFKEAEVISPLRTRDIDIDVSQLKKAKTTAIIPDLMKEIGFEIIFHGDGSISLTNDKVYDESGKTLPFGMDFLVPEIGKESDKPIKIPGFGITAQPLRYIDLLEKEIITVDYKGLQVKVSHPAYFGILKLITSQVRKGITNEKVARDIRQGLEVLYMAKKLGYTQKVKDIISGMTKKRKRYIEQAFKQTENDRLLVFFFDELAEIREAL